MSRGENDAVHPNSETRPTRGHDVGGQVGVGRGITSPRKEAAGEPDRL